MGATIEVAGHEDQRERPGPGRAGRRPDLPVAARPRRRAATRACHRRTDSVLAVAPRSAEPDRPLREGRSRRGPGAGRCGDPRGPAAPRCMRTRGRSTGSRRGRASSTGPPATPACSCASVATRTGCTPRSTASAARSVAIAGHRVPGRSRRHVPPPARVSGPHVHHGVLRPRRRTTPRKWCSMAVVREPEQGAEVPRAGARGSRDLPVREHCAVTTSFELPLVGPGGEPVDLARTLALARLRRPRADAPRRGRPRRSR